MGWTRGILEEIGARTLGLMVCPMIPGLETVTLTLRVTTEDEARRIFAKSYARIESCMFRGIYFRFVML